MMRFCQLKRKYLLVIIAIIFFGCSSSEFEKRWTAKKTDASWFKTKKRFAAFDKDGDYQLNPFFDFHPDIDIKSGAVNFVAVTPYGNSIGYDIDIVSGQLYKNFVYCNQDDVWESYKGGIKYPNYTEGVIPRFVNASSEIQRILVFGRGGFYLKTRAIEPQRVRIIGGIQEQFCKRTKCISSSEWESRIVLVAVDPKDSKFEDVKNFTDLKKQIDWFYTKAFFENGKGRTIAGKNQHPAYRIFAEYTKDEAIRRVMTGRRCFL